MESLRFKRLTHGLLRMIKTSSLEMEILGDFLEQDVYSVAQDYLNWVQSTVAFTGGNTSYVIKSKGNIIIESNITNDSITLTKEQFIDILQQWEKFYTARPEDFIIKKIDDKFVFEVIQD